MTHIVIMGSGVVGTATGRGFAAHGHQVRFVDIDPQRIRALRADGFEAVDHLTLGGTSTVVFLTLPTPNDGYRWDLDAFTAGVHDVGRALADSSAFHTVVTRSTVPPGTTENLVGPALEAASAKQVGLGFALASNPEFLRAQCAYEDFINPWMTVIGARSKRTVERLEALLSPFGGELRTFSDPAQTEMIKCAHNIYNATKISFWNEMWQVAGRIGVDPHAVADTVSRSAEGSFSPAYGIRGGAAYGGACLPKDTKGFIGFARAVGAATPLLSAVDGVNETMRELEQRDRHTVHAAARGNGVEASIVGAR